MAAKKTRPIRPRKSVLVAPLDASAQDATKGKSAYARCAVCHSVDQSRNAPGPDLGGIVGRKAGKTPKFNYSEAIAGSALTWHDDTLDRFLTAPQWVVKETKMEFPVIKNAADRANIIAYLKTTKRSK